MQEIPRLVSKGKNEGLRSIPQMLNLPYPQTWEYS